MCRNCENSREDKEKPEHNAPVSTCSLRQTRTADRVVNSHLLYRLSYQGKNICNVQVRALLVNIP